MKKISYLLLLAFLCFSCVKVTVSPAQAKPNSTTVKASTHIIVCQQVLTGKIGGWGSSVAIQHEAGQQLKLLTARHVVDNDCQKKGGILLLQVGNHYTPFEINAIAKKGIDLALITTRSNYLFKRETLPIAASQGQEGDKIFTAGFPCCSGYYMIESGTLANLKVRSSLDNRYYIYLSSLIRQGSSGGPTLNEKFEIIGINVQGEKNVLGIPMHHTYSVPLREIKDFLKKNNVPY